MNTIEMANRCLDFLRASFMERSTKQVLIGVQRNHNVVIDHADLRKVLNRLYKCGVVKRSGVGNFYWKLIQKEWDRTWPFKDFPETKPKDEVYNHNHQPGSSPNPYTKEVTENEIVLKGNPQPNNALTESLVRTIAAMAQRINELDAKLDDANKKVGEQGALLDDLRTMKQSFVRKLEIKKYDGNTVVLKDKILPKAFDRVRTLAECRRNILLVGPAGCGKTYLAKLIADSLILDFAALSCTSGMSEAHLLGRAVPDLTKGKNRFQSTDFLRVYENGGIGLLDELDASDANLMLCVNSGLANGYMNVPNRPDKPQAIRHDDFVCIGTANTVGRGATRMYTGRNQLDEATLDRFRIGIVECYYDPNVELAVCPDIGGEEGRKYIPKIQSSESEQFLNRLVSIGYNLRDTCLFIRDKIEAGGMRRIMSSRFLEDAYVMCNVGRWTLKDVLQAFFEGWTSEEKAKVC